MVLPYRVDLGPENMSRQQMPRFGMILKELRTAAGLTQETLAERAGVSVRGLQDLERGQSQTPRRDTVELLAAALGLAGWERMRFVEAARLRPIGAGDPAAVAVSAPFAAGALLPLVGRASELALLERFLNGARAPLGSPPALLLAGEPGIGKTRMLQAAAERAIAQGWHVLVGGCRRRGGQEPYAPLLEALAVYLHAAGTARLRAALEGCAWLVRLLPEFAADLEPLPARAMAPEHERRLVFAAVARLLANVAGPAGTLLLLDDLQWAGADTLDLLASLLRAGSLPLRLIGAYRDTEVRPGDPLGLLLADLAQARLARRRPLGPLAPAEAANLLDDLLIDLPEGNRGMVEVVLQRSGGTPFFLISYAQALHQGSGTGVPWDLAQGVRQRVALLPPAGQALLGVAAVMGRHASRMPLLAVAGQPEADALAGLEAACRARLLLEEGEDAYVFAHDVIREVVEADLGAARRAVLHRKVAEAFEDDPLGVSPETLAYHYDRGDTPDKAVRYLERAGDHAWSQRAHAAAEGHFREALDRLESLGRGQDAARVREKLGEVLTRMGRYEAALQVLEQAAEAYQVAGDWESLGRVAAGIAEADALRGASEARMARLHGLLEQLERGGGSPAPAALYLWWGMFLTGGSRYGEALAALDRAAELARAAGDERTLVRAIWNRADILQRLGKLAEALRAFSEVLPLAEALDDPEALLSVHRNLALICALRGDFGVGRHYGDRALTLAEQLENPPNHSGTLALRGWLAVLVGDMPTAHADLSQALAMSRQVGPSWYSPYVLTFQGRLALAEGDWDGAATALQEAGDLAEGSGDLQALRWAATTMAELDILEGRAEAAGARLAPLLDRPGLEECDVTTLLPVLAWAQLERGDVEQAAGTVGQALARTRPAGMRLVLVEALRVHARLSLRRGMWDVAARSLEEGLALARAMPYPYAEARLLHLDGRRLSAQGDAGPAQAQLEAALALFRRLGAGQDAAAVARDLTALSQNPAPPQNPAPAFEPAPSRNLAPSRYPAPAQDGAPLPVEPQLTDAQWARIATLLPPLARTGRPRVDDRGVLEAILYRERTGCAWAELPAALGDRATAHRRLRQWQAAGLWARIAAIAQTPPSTQGDQPGHHSPQDQ